MQLIPLGTNKTEIVFGDRTVFFSYKTPVAMHIRGLGYFKTEKRWSITTTKHITQWLNGNKAEEKPQAFFDEAVLLVGRL